MLGEEAHTIAREILQENARDPVFAKALGRALGHHALDQLDKKIIYRPVLH